MTMVRYVSLLLVILSLFAAPRLLGGGRSPVRDYQYKFISSERFNGRDLGGANFSYSVISGTWFQKAKLSKAILEYCVATDAKFDGADLAGAQLNYSVLSDASFKGADCRGARFGYCVLVEADFTGADLRGAKFPGAVLGGRFDAKTVYDEATQFPRGFDPVKAGLTLVRTEAEGQGAGAPSH